MLGYWGTPGGGPPLNLGPERDIPLQASWGPTGKYSVPKLYRSHYWAQAVLLLDKVRAGELAEEDYRRMVGWRADPAILKDFNPRMLFWGGFSPHGSNHLITACETSNYQVPAMERMEFYLPCHLDHLFESLQL